MTHAKLYKRQRSPAEIIQYAEWLYRRFNLRHRDVEDLLAKRRERHFRTFSQLSTLTCQYLVSACLILYRD
jgi:transposase-like protein